MAIPFAIENSHVAKELPDRSRRLSIPSRLANGPPKSNLIQDTECPRNPPKPAPSFGIHAAYQPPVWGGPNPFAEGARGDGAAHRRSERPIEEGTTPNDAKHESDEHPSKEVVSGSCVECGSDGHPLKKTTTPDGDEDKQGLSQNYADPERS